MGFLTKITDSLTCDPSDNSNSNENENKLIERNPDFSQPDLDSFYCLVILGRRYKTENIFSLDHKSSDIKVFFQKIAYLFLWMAKRRCIWHMVHMFHVQMYAPDFLQIPLKTILIFSFDKTFLQ